MEMHSRKSLYEIHGISVPPRRQRRWRSLARRGIARTLAVLQAIATAIQAELATRRAIRELASMDDHMLRDIGLTRGEIQITIRGPRGNVGLDERPMLSGDIGQHDAALPTINSPDLSSEGRSTAIRGDCARGRQFEPGTSAVRVKAGSPRHRADVAR